jgi:hypothetical protein
MIKYTILILLLLIAPATAEYDCLEYALAADEPIILVGKHPYFYGSLDSRANHYLNYEIIDNETMRFTDHNTSSSMNVSTISWEEIRPGVYFDGFDYFKMFLYREPQRYWRKMI